MSTAPSTAAASNLRILKPQVHKSLYLAKGMDPADFANAVPITAQDGAPTHTPSVLGELYIRTDSTGVIPTIYRGTSTSSAIWEPVGPYSAAITAASTAVSATSTETDFDQTITLPANLLVQGSVLRVFAQGIATATNSTDTLTVKLYVGSTVVATSAAVDVANNDTWVFDFSLTARAAAGASAACVGAGTGTLGASGTATMKHISLASTNFATNGTLTIKMSATWSSTNAGNSCRLDVLNATVV